MNIQKKFASIVDLPERPKMLVYGKHKPEDEMEYAKDSLKYWLDILLRFIEERKDWTRKLKINYQDDDQIKTINHRIAFYMDIEGAALQQIYWNGLYKAAYPTWKELFLKELWNKGYTSLTVEKNIKFKLLLEKSAEYRPYVLDALDDVVDAFSLEDLANMSSEVVKFRIKCALEDSNRQHGVYELTRESLEGYDNW